MSNARNLSFLTDFINSSGTLGQQGILNFRGTWDSGIAYAVNDVVYWGTGYQRCLIANTGYEPLNLSTSRGYWSTIIFNQFNWIGTWSSSYKYYQNDVVVYKGFVYICYSNHNGTLGTPDQYTGSYWSAPILNAPSDNFSTFLLMGA
jgi:hypothetical protein